MFKLPCWLLCWEFVLRYLHSYQPVDLAIPRLKWNGKEKSLLTRLIYKNYIPNHSKRITLGNIFQKVHVFKLPCWLLCWEFVMRYLHSYLPVGQAIPRLNTLNEVTSLQREQERLLLLIPCGTERTVGRSHVYKARTIRRLRQRRAWSVRNVLTVKTPPADNPLLIRVFIWLWWWGGWGGTVRWERFTVPPHAAVPADLWKGGTIYCTYK